MKYDFLAEARKINDELLKHRRYLHENAEVGFSLNKTKEYVKEKLEEMGCTVFECGKSGLYTCIGKGDGKTFLLRADMDALSVEEETDLSFASKNGSMHACGHDMHTAMLLGAAQILKKHEEELEGTVKLMFQPAEELLEGAKDMIESGVLEEPVPDAGMMIHVMPAVPFQVGTVVIAPPGASAPAADYFEIKVKGRGCHGSMPAKGIDPVIASAHIILALETIQTRELPFGEKMALTIGMMQGGDAPNVIPDSVTLGGSMRAFSEKTREFIKKRIAEIVAATAKTYRGEAKVNFGSGCPTLLNDEKLTDEIYEYIKELLGKENVLRGENIGNGDMGAAGSEDFAYVSHEIPTVMIALAAGEPEKGYLEALHHPKVTFSEEILEVGSAVYAGVAFSYLNEKKIGGG